MTAALPGTTLTTPAGMPASTHSSPMAIALSGVLLAGFTIIVQPAARAGPSLRVIMADGRFHGVMAALTPMGWRSTRMRLSGTKAWTISP